MNTVDNRIVNLQFNNKDFEKNAATSMKTCDELEKKLSFKGIKNGLDNLGVWFNGVKGLFTSLEKSAGDALKPLEQGAQQATQAFHPLREMAIGALRDIGVEAKNTAKNLIEALSIDQVKEGYGKLDEKTRSVKTIMSATGDSIEYVNKQLEKLNWYTDETSYSYTDMTNNIGKFTNANVPLKDAVTAMIGIGNAAGLAGASVQDASHAMAGFAKAMGQGYMGMQEWNWIQTAHMDTTDFKRQMIANAESLGVIQKGEIALNEFESTIGKKKWLTSDVIVQTLKSYGATTEKIYNYIQENGGYTSDAIEAIGISAEDLGLKAFKASQEATTFADALDSVKDAVSTGWMTSFETIIGNYEQAKTLWTDLANWLYDVIAESGNARNELLKKWRDKWTFGLNDLGGRAYLLEGLYEIFDTMAEYIHKVGEAIETVFGKDWDADLLYSLTQGIHDFAQVFASTVEDGVFDYETKGTIIWFRKNLEQLLYIIKNITEVVGFLGDTFVKAIEYALGFVDLTDAIKQGWDETGQAAADSATTIGKTLYKALYSVNAFIRRTFLSSDAKEKIRLIANQVGNIIVTIRDIILSAAKSITTAFRTVYGSVGNFSLSGIMSVLNIVRFLADTILEVISSVSSFSKTTNLATIVSTILTGLKSAGAIISSLIRTLSPVVRTFIPIVVSYITAIANILERIVGGSILDAIVAFITNLPVTLELLEEMMRGLLELLRPFAILLTDVIDIIGRAATIAINYIGRLYRAFKTRVLDTGLFAIFSERLLEFSEALTNLFSVLTSKGNKIIDSVEKYSQIDGEESFGWINFLVEAATNAIIFLTNALPTITGLIERFTDLISSIKISMTDGLSDADGKSLFSVLNYNMKHLFDDIDHDALKTDAAAYSKSTFGGFIEGISAALRSANINWDTVKPVAGFLAFLSMIVLANKTLLSLDDLLEDLQKIPTTFGELIINFNGIFKNISECVETINESIKELTIIQKIKAIAVALAILGATVWILAQLPRDALARGIVALSLIAVILGIMMKVMKDLGTTFGGNVNNTTTNSGNTNILSGNVTTINTGLMGAALAIAALAGFVLVVMAAIEKIKDINTGELIKAGVTIAIMLTLLTASLVILGKIGTELKNVSTTDVLTSNGAKKKNLLETTSGYFVTLAVAIGTFALSIMAISASINSMALVAQKTDGYFAAGVGAFTAIVGMLTLVMIALAGIDILAKDSASIPNMSRRLLVAATAMSIVALAINIATVPVLALAAVSKAGVDLPTLMREVIIPFFGMIAAITLLLAAGERFAAGGSLIKAATSLSIFAVALNLILLPLSAMGVVATEDSLKGLSGVMQALTVALIAMAVAAMLVPNTTSMTWIAKSIAVFASSVLIIAASMALLQHLGTTEAQVDNIGAVFAALLGEIGFLLFSLTAGFKYLGVSAAEVMTIAGSIVTMSAAFLIMAAALAVMSEYARNIDLESLTNRIAQIIGVIALIGVVFGLLSTIAPMAAILQAFASTITAIGTVLIGFALVVLSLGASLYLFGKAMPAIAEAMPRFVESINLLGEGLKKNKDVMTLATIIVVALTAGLIVLMATLAHALPTIGAGISGFISSLSGLSWKTKAIGSAAIIGLAIGLAEATPEVLEAIHYIFDLIMARLGEMSGWIIDGLLKLLIELLYGLADAIRNNAGAIAYAIWDIGEAVGEIILDVLASTLGTLLNIIAAGAQWLADAALNNFNPKYTFDYYLKSVAEDDAEVLKGLKSAMRTYLGYTKEFLDDTELEVPLKLNAMEESDESATVKLFNEWFGKITTKGKEKAAEAGSAMGGSLVTSLADAVGIEDIGGIDGLMDKLLGGETLSTDTWTKILSLDGLDIGKLQDEMYGSLGSISLENVEGFNSAASAFGDFSISVGDGTEDINNAFLSINDTAGDTTGQMVEDISTSGEDAEIKMVESMDGLLGVVNNRQSDFYQAGTALIRNLQSGVDDTWSSVAESVKSKFRQLADDLRTIMSKDNIYGDVTPVISSDNPYEYIDRWTPSWINKESVNEAVGRAATDVNNAKSTDDTTQLTSAIKTINDELKSIKEANAKFHSDFDAYKAELSGMAIVMDTGTVVGELKTPMFGEFSNLMRREMRGG